LHNERQLTACPHPDWSRRLEPSRPGACWPGPSGGEANRRRTNAPLPQRVFSYDADVATDLRLLNTHDIVNLWADSTAEMKRRGIVRTRNVIGDLAETIAEAHLHGTRGSFSNKGWDLTTPDGERVQVKGLWRTSPTRTKLSAIRDSD
jgi:hypothetical protein